MSNLIEQINSLLRNQSVGNWNFVICRRTYSSEGIEIVFTNSDVSRYFINRMEYEYLQHMSVNDIIQNTLVQIPGYNKARNIAKVNEYLGIK